MKLKVFKCLFTLIIFYLIASPISSNNSIKIVTDRDYPPFTYIDEKGKLVGISVEFWNMWSEKTGIKVELIPEEWIKAQNMLFEGKVSAIDEIFKTPEREKYLVFSKPVFKVTSSIYYHKSISKINSPKDITPFIVGVKRGDALIDFLLLQNPYVNFRFYRNYSDIILSAKNGEIKVFIMDDPPASYYLTKHDMIYDFFKGPIIYTNYLHVASLKNKANIISVINDGLSKIPQEDIEKLLEKYSFGKEVPPYFPKVILYIVIVGFFILLLALSYNRILSLKVREATKELKIAHDNLKEQIDKFEFFIRNISDISDVNLKDYDFAKRVLRISILLLDKDTYGIFFDRNMDSLRILAIDRYDKNLEGLLISKEDGDNILNIQNITLIKEPSFLKDINMKEMLLYPIKWQERIYGYLACVIPKESTYSFEEREAEILERFGNIISAFYGIRVHIREREVYLSKMVTLLVKTLEYYDKYTQGHSERVAKYAVKVAEKLDLPPEKIKKIYWASLLHDIGKIYVPQSILNKNGRLTQEEFEIIKIHPIKSEEILKQVDEFKDLAEIVRHHHERWDGLGYPDGLSAYEIPLESRIIAMSDAFDAMTSERPYKRAMTLEEAILEIEKNKGKQFDPQIAEIMIKIIKEEIIEKNY
uniref:Transporter substrate-binding domain-containing protein n=1 Tax=Dictyoglomus turgidum TaxID=513050 RepID=A0A7C3WWI0_9BACT